METGIIGKLDMTGAVHGSAYLNENREIISRPVNKPLEPTFAAAKQRQAAIAKQVEPRHAASINPISLKRISVYA